MLIVTLLACGEPVSNLAADLAPQVSTVVEVSFTLDTQAETCVRYWVDGDEHTTPSRDLDAGDHMLRILGVPSATEVTWRLETDADGLFSTSEQAILRTGNLPAAVPVLPTLTAEEDGLDEPWILAAVMTSHGTDVNIIMNREGDVVWYSVDPDGLTAPWIQAAPGEGILSNRFDPGFCDDLGEVRTVDMSGEVTATTRTEDGHHAFLRRDDGTLAWLAVDRREYAAFAKPVCGDRILELAPGETEPTEVFSTFDAIEVTENTRMGGDFYCGCLDWTHANMLSWDDDTQSYLISLANLDSILQVDRETGAVERSFGELEGSYAFQPADATFNHQHGSHFTADGSLLLTETDPYTHLTQATEYRPDPETGTLTVAWSFLPTDDLRAMALGEAHRLENGNTLVNFGSAGSLQEVSPDGQVLWEAYAEASQFFGTSLPLSDLYALE